MMAKSIGGLDEKKKKNTRADGCTSSCHINRIIFLYGITGIMDFGEDDNDGDVGYVSSWREGLSFAMKRRGIRGIAKKNEQRINMFSPAAAPFKVRGHVRCGGAGGDIRWEC